MALVDTVTKMFASKSTIDLAVVREKLLQAEFGLPALSARVRETALAAALDTAAENRHRKAVVAHQQQQQLIESLRLALAEADRIEQTRLVGVRTAQQKAKLRAAKSHLGNMVRAAEDYERAAAQMTGAWRRVVDASESLQALLGNGWSQNYGELSRRRLLNLFELARKIHCAT